MRIVKKLGLVAGGKNSYDTLVVVWQVFGWP